MTYYHALENNKTLKGTHQRNICTMGNNFHTVLYKSLITESYNTIFNIRVFRNNIDSQFCRVCSSYFSFETKRTC